MTATDRTHTSAPTLGLVDDVRRRLPHGWTAGGHWPDGTVTIYGPARIRIRVAPDRTWDAERLTHADDEAGTWLESGPGLVGLLAWIKAQPVRA